MVNFEAIIFYLFLLESVSINIAAWFCAKWFKKKFPVFSKHLPVTKAWAALYLILVLWIGYSLFRLGIF